jgi:site-specific DNA recombinase
VARTPKPTTSPRSTPAQRLQQLDPLWDELFPAEQARVVALLVERVDIGTDGPERAAPRVDGLSGLAREMLAGDMGAAA